MSNDIRVEYVALSEIVGADVNPKDHDIGQIYQSMKRFGFTSPIMMNEKTGKLLAGHGRLETLAMFKKGGDTPPERIRVREEDGEWLVPVLRGINFDSDVEAQAYLLADNRLTELGGWHTDELVMSLQGILQEGGDLEGVGWDLDDVEDLITDSERERFEVEPIREVSDEEDSVQIRVGRYRFKVDPDYFYEWETMVTDILQSNDPEEFIEWIREQLKMG